MLDFGTGANPVDVEVRAPAGASFTSEVVESTLRIRIDLLNRREKFFVGLNVLDGERNNVRVAARSENLSLSVSDTGLNIATVRGRLTAAVVLGAAATICALLGVSVAYIVSGAADKRAVEARQMVDLEMLRTLCPASSKVPDSEKQ